MKRKTPDQINAEIATLNAKLADMDAQFEARRARYLARATAVQRKRNNLMTAWMHAVVRVEVEAMPPEIIAALRQDAPPLEMLEALQPFGLVYVRPDRVGWTMTAGFAREVLAEMAKETT